ncbi:MAG: hypothetical protein ACOYN5_14165 [Bacteroidales bacterium]
MIIRQILFLAFLFISGFIRAQSDFRPGFVIQNSGDTLFGSIDYRGDMTMGSLCRFKTAENEIRDFSPFDIPAYRFTDSKYFISREVDGKMVFLEFLIKGKVNVYYLRDDVGDHFYLDKEGERLTELVYSEEVKMIKENPNKEKRYLVKSNKHIGVLSYYMQDAPDLQPKIKSIAKPEQQNLINLAEKYHNEVCKDEECIIFEKKLPLFKANLEIIGGFVDFGLEDDIADGLFFQSGVLVHIWMPRANEKLYFKTGIIYARPEFNNGKRTNYLKIPMHLVYLAPKSMKIRPTASIGLLSPSYSAGFLVGINETVSLGVQSWLNFYANDRFFLLPAEFNNYSVLASVYFDL